MSDDKKKVKISFAPGAFDKWEGSQEELDEFIEELKKQIETGELFENTLDLDLTNMEVGIDDIEIENDEPKKLH